MCIGNYAKLFSRFMTFYYAQTFLSMQVGNSFYASLNCFMRRRFARKKSLWYLLLDLTTFSVLES